jgi:hypothetical protein
MAQTRPATVCHPCGQKNSHYCPAESAWLNNGQEWSRKARGRIALSWHGRSLRVSNTSDLCGSGDPCDGKITAV